MPERKILVTDPVHPILIDSFRSRGFAVDYFPDITLEEVKNLLPDYWGLVVNTKIPVDRGMVLSAPGLRAVARLGSGKEILDLVALRERDVAVITTPEANCNAVAEHALGLTLSLLRHVVRADREVREFQWIREANRGRELSSMRVGILGYGHTGRRFCQLLSGFGCGVLIHDPFIGFNPEFAHHKKAECRDDLHDCDIISLHVSYLPENHHLVDRNFIASMKQPWYLINTSRGRVVDLDALAEGIESGKVRGAGLDVLENEKLSSFTAREILVHRRLSDSGKVIFSPHIAGWTIESREGIARSILEQWPDNQ